MTDGVCPLCDCKAHTVDWRARAIAAEAAIRNHRDQRGDDRCFLDDAELYAVLGDEAKAETALPPREEFLANCARFYACRQNPDDKYQTVVEERQKLVTERDLYAQREAALRTWIDRELEYYALNQHGREWLGHVRDKLDELSTAHVQVPIRTPHAQLAVEAEEWSSGKRTPAGWDDAPEAVPLRVDCAELVERAFSAEKQVAALRSEARMARSALLSSVRMGGRGMTSVQVAAACAHLDAAVHASPTNAVDDALFAASEFCSLAPPWGHHDAQRLLDEMREKLAALGLFPRPAKGQR